MMTLQQFKQGRATPGKRAMGLAVVADDGTPVTAAASLIRNLLRAVDFLPIAYGTGLVCMLIDRNFRRLGDLAAGTLVVHVRLPRKAGEIPLCEPIPLPRALPLEVQQAILGYAERGPDLSPERRAELAGTLSGVTGQRGESAEQVLLGYANWLTRGH